MKFLFLKSSNHIYTYLNKNSYIIDYYIYQLIIIVSLYVQSNKL